MISCKDNADDQQDTTALPRINKAAAVGTQLRLQDRNICRLDECLQQQLRRTSLTLFHTLTVLYIYDNQIQSLQGVERLNCLRELYAQNNQIADVSALSGCRTLRKLYLNRNRITLFNATGLDSLHVLSVEGQQQPSSGDTALQLSLQAFCDMKELTSLLLSKNRLAIGYGESIGQLPNLQILDLQQCQLEDWHELMRVLRGAKSLRSLRLKGNPLVNAKYRDSLLLLSRSLYDIDGRPVSTSERRAVEHMASVRRRSSQ